MRYNPNTVTNAFSKDDQRMVNSGYEGNNYIDYNQTRIKDNLFTSPSISKNTIPLPVNF